MSEERIMNEPVVVEYDGLFSVKDVMHTIFDFFTQRGYIFYEKVQTEDVTEKGREFMMKGDFKKKLNYYAESLIALKIKGKGVKEVDVVRDKHKKTLNKGKISIELEPVLVTDLEGRYEVSLLAYIFKAFAERFFFKKEFDHLSDIILKDFRKAEAIVRGLLNLEKYK